MVIANMPCSATPLLASRLSKRWFTAASMVCSLLYYIDATADAALRPARYSIDICVSSVISDATSILSETRHDHAAAFPPRPHRHGVPPVQGAAPFSQADCRQGGHRTDRKSTRLNSSH